jgi:hypothetical protein
VDDLGLAYSARGGRIIVYYPQSDPGGEGASRHNTGFDIGPIPESYWTDPPNVVTGQRAELWRTLLQSAAARPS